jgi:hypothetical protein
LTKRIEPGFHSIASDDEHEAAVKKSVNTSVAKPQKMPASKKSVKAESTVTKNSPAVLLSTLLIYALISAGGYWFFQQSIKTEKILASSEQRILDLESQLSATGEEMGESTVALKVKLENLTKKNNELWKENDKLWASAWRRNQTEIKALDKQVTSLLSTLTANKKSLTTISTTLSAINEKQTAAEFNVDAITEKLKAVNTLSEKLTTFSKELSSLQSKSLSRDTQQIEIASNITALNSLHKELSAQVDSLAMTLADLKANRPLSSGTTSTPSSVTEL